MYDLFKLTAQFMKVEEKTDDGLENTNRKNQT